MKNSQQYQRIVPLILFALALMLLFKLVRPMITILLSSVLLAYLGFPLYQKISKRIPSQSVSIIAALMIIVLLVLIPFTFLAFEITQQGYYFYSSLSTTIAKGALFGFGCTSAESKICSFINQAEKFSLERLSSFGFDKQLQKFLPIIEEKMTLFILSIPLALVQVFITVIISYFILKGWRTMLLRMVSFLPMRKKTIEVLIVQFRDIAHTVIYAQLFVALVQGIAGTLGFYLLGVPFPIFFGVLMAFCALIPTIGTAIIWLPASLVLIIGGYSYGDYGMLGRGVALFIYGLAVISTIDNFLLARIVHAKAKVNQIIVIIGVIGGASLFGVAGIFIGPILLPLLITYFETFKERYL